MRTATPAAATATEAGNQRKKLNKSSLNGAALIVTSTLKERHRDTITYACGHGSGTIGFGQLVSLSLASDANELCTTLLRSCLNGTIPGGEGRVQSMPDQVLSQFVGVR